MTITKEDIESIVTEVTENVYENSTLNLDEYKGLEPVISNLRYENEVIITETAQTIIEILMAMEE